MERISNGFLNAPIFSIELSGEVGHGFGPFWRGSELIGRLIRLRRHFAHLIRRNHQPKPIWAIEILKKLLMAFWKAKFIAFGISPSSTVFPAFITIFRKTECYAFEKSLWEWLKFSQSVSQHFTAEALSLTLFWNF